MKSSQILYDELRAQLVNEVLHHFCICTRHNYIININEHYNER